MEQDADKLIVWWKIFILQRQMTSTLTKKSDKNMEFFVGKGDVDLSELN
jgi:hypothetical protein